MIDIKYSKIKKTLDEAKAFKEELGGSKSKAWTLNTYHASLEHFAARMANDGRGIPGMKFASTEIFEATGEGISIPKRRLYDIADILKPIVYKPTVASMEGGYRNMCGVYYDKDKQAAVATNKCVLARLPTKVEYGGVFAVTKIKQLSIDVGSGIADKYVDYEFILREKTNKFGVLDIEEAYRRAKAAMLFDKMAKCYDVVGRCVVDYANATYHFDAGYIFEAILVLYRFGANNITLSFRVGQSNSGDYLTFESDNGGLAVVAGLKQERAGKMPSGMVVDLPYTRIRGRKR